MHKRKKQVNNAKDIAAVISVYNVIEYRDNYSKTAVSLWRQYRDEPYVSSAKVLRNDVNSSGKPLM